MIAIIGHAIAVTAAILGTAAWSVLALGFSYSWLFVPKDRKVPKAVMSPRVAAQVLTVAAVACTFAAGFIVAMAALVIGESTRWAWIGAAASAAFLVPFGGAIAFAHCRDLARRK